MPNPTATLTVTVRSVSQGYQGTLTLAVSAVELAPGGIVEVGFTLDPAVAPIDVNVTSNALGLVAAVALNAAKDKIVLTAGAAEGSGPVVLEMVVE